MKIHIINNFYSLNRGWALLILSVTGFLLRRNPNISFTLESIFPEIDAKVYRNCRCVISIKSSHKLFMSSLTRALMWRLLSTLGVKADSILNTEPLKYYGAADLILDLSGDGLCPARSRTLWYHIRRKISTLTNLACILTALLLEKPVILYSQSIGNLGLLKYLVKIVLNSGNVRLIAVRDAMSQSYLENLGVNKRKIILVGDASLSVTSPNVNPNPSSTVFGFCLSAEASVHFYGYTTQEFKKFVNKIFNYVKNAYSAKILIIPFSLGGRWSHENDTETFIEFSKKNEAEFFIRKKFDLTELLSKIAECKLFVTARMHAAMLALSCNVPTIMIAHSPKFYGFAESLNCRDLILDASELSDEKLRSKIDYVMRNYGSIKSRIKGNVKKIRAMSLNGLEKLSEELQAIVVESI